MPPGHFTRDWGWGVHGAMIAATDSLTDLRGPQQLLTLLPLGRDLTSVEGHRSMSYLDKTKVLFIP